MDEKYKDLYLLAKELHAEEVRRFDLVTQKARSYLSVLSVLLGFAAVVGKWTLATILPPSNVLEWLLLVSGTAVFVFLVLAWFSSFRVLRGEVLSKMPLNAEMLDFFDDNEPMNIYFALSKRYTEGHAFNQRQTEKRTKFLAAAHRRIVFAGLSFIAFSTFSIAYVWYHPVRTRSEIKNGGSIMSESKQDPAQSPKTTTSDAPRPSGPPADGPSAGDQQQSPPSGGPSETPAPSAPKPDRTVEAPAMQLITHGAQDSAARKIILNGKREDSSKPAHDAGDSTGKDK